MNASGLRVHNANLSGANIHCSNMCGVAITGSMLDGMTVNGVAVTELLRIYEQHAGATKTSDEKNDIAPSN